MACRKMWSPSKKNQVNNPPLSRQLNAELTTETCLEMLCRKVRNNELNCTDTFSPPFSCDPFTGGSTNGVQHLFEIAQGIYDLGELNPGEYLQIEFACFGLVLPENATQISLIKYLPEGGSIGIASTLFYPPNDCPQSDCLCCNCDCGCT